MKKELPVLLTPEQVRAVLGKVPRSLENMVVAGPSGKKLFRKREVMQRAKAK